MKNFPFHESIITKTIKFTERKKENRNKKKKYFFSVNSDT